MDLRKLRDMRGLTQEELAREVGVTTRQYRSYEKGEQLPNILTGWQIAKLLGVDDPTEIFKAKPTTRTRSQDVPDNEPGGDS